MSRKYGESIYQCGRYQAIGWESLCTPDEVWTPEEPESAFITYHFDASVEGPTDPEGVWTDDAKAFDGSLTTFASVSSIDGSPAFKYLSAKGYSEEPISLLKKSVKARFYGLAGGAAARPRIYADFFTGSSSIGRAVIATDVLQWSQWAELTPITLGGWASEVLSSIELRLYAIDLKTASAVDAEVYAIELEVEYEIGWTSETIDQESWSQTDPRT